MSSKECLGLQTCMVKHLGVCLYGFGKAMSERVLLKVLYVLYFIALYTNWGAWGDKWVLGVGPTHLVSYLLFLIHG